MANATEWLLTEAIGTGVGPYNFHLPVDAGSKIFKGTLVAQLTATGQAVPYSTASSGWVVGVAQHDADNSASGTSDGDKRITVEAGRMYAFDNGAGGDAFSDTSMIGSPVYGSDDHTVADNSNSAARKFVGLFMGFNADGKVRVLVCPWIGWLVNALATLTDAPATADALRDNIVASML